MCVIGLKDEDCFSWIIDDFESLLTDLELMPKEYAHGFYCGMRTHLGSYDSEIAKELLWGDQKALHLDLFSTYVNTVDMFPILTKDEVIDATRRIIEILGKLEPVITKSQEEEHECSNDYDCYFDEYVKQRDRAIAAETLVEAYKQEMFIMRQRELSLEKQLKQIKRQRVIGIRNQQARKRKNRR